MLTSKAFDILAEEYDDAFNRSMIGIHQRKRTRVYLQHFLNGKKDLKILEINCGTGDDALWLSSLGHHVIATDQSPKMIEQANRKNEFHSASVQPEFLVCDFNEIEKRFEGETFDLIFSNFAGLNCASPAEIKKLGVVLQNLLKPGGHLAFVLFGKYTAWESFYYLSKFQLKNAIRRWTNKKQYAPLSKEVVQPVYYYSIKSFLNLLRGFIMEEKKPVGLFIPPSYLEKAVENRPRLFDFLLRMENRFGHFSAASSFADHFYILLKNKK